MIPSLARWCLPLIVLALILPAFEARALTDEQVEQEINKLKQYLYQQQDPQIGGWFGQYHAHPREGGDEQNPEKNKNLGGPTTMATLALLVAGESSQDPRMAKAIEYLRTLDIYGTYALSVKVHVWSYLPDRYLDNLERDAQLLLSGADPERSSWRYWVYPKPSTDWDNSTNQYGILGMWQYAQRGGRIDNKFWDNAAKHFLATQRDNGGWGYRTTDHRLTMTCAGLTCLAVVQQELFRDRDKPVDNIAKAMDRGMEYLHDRYKPGEGAHGGGGYYRYGVERVALATGVKYLKGKDWFEDIGTVIVKSAGGSSVVNSSFDLMFLARGRVPVWVNKIQLTNGAWKNRPNDMYFFSRHLSKLSENEVNWQYVGLENPVMDYLPAPVAWLSSDDKVVFNEKEKENLKLYLDLGGMLVANQENSSSFEQSIIELAAELYPDYKWTGLETTHPLGNLLYRIEGSSLPVKVLSNGTRPLIIMPDRDWGLPLQKDRDLTKSQPGQIMTNLYAMVSDRGSLPNRLVREFPTDSPNRSSHTKVYIGLAKFGPDNKMGNPEPAAWTAVRNILGTEGALNLQWATTPLSEIGGGTVEFDGQPQPIKLLHLAGSELDANYQLSEAEKQAIKAFVDGGGTIFLEGVGGRSEFAVNMERQLSEVLGAGGSRLSSVDPIISGAGGAAGRSVGTAVYRKFSIINMSAGTRPRLGAIMVNGRAAVVISSEDVSMGALGIRHWGVNGYQSQTARQILTNMILAVK